MAIREVFNPKFDYFHERSMVTWKEANHPPRIDANLYDQYNLWKSTKLPKHEPSAAFWQSGGPAIVRALSFCGAKALVLEYANDRRVTYQWFAHSPRRYSSPESDWYSICSVYAEGVREGSDTRVHVTLPSDEDVVFMFKACQMVEWLKPPLETKVEP
jgi:hypothetical protein